MKQDLQSIFIVFVAIIMASMLIRILGLKSKDTNTWYGLMLLITGVAFLSHNLYIVSLACILIKLIYLKNDLDKNVFFYLFMLPILPSLGSIDFPLDSVPIFDLRYQEMLALIILVPLIPKLIYESNRFQRNIILSLPILYLVGFDVLMEWRDEIDLSQTRVRSIIENTITNKVRGTLEVLIFTLVPFYTIAVWLNSEKRFCSAVRAIAMSAVVILIVAVPAAILGWDIYKGIFGVSGRYYIRDGLLRLSLTPGQLGFVASLFFFVVLGFVARLRKGRVGLVVAVFVALPALYFGTSRGAQIGAIIGLCCFFYFRMPSINRLIAILFSIVMFAVVAFPLVKDIDSIDFSKVDTTADAGKQGTFEYRQKFIVIGLSLIPDNPFFGDRNVYSRPEMENLRQGQGIIDPVNSYLNFALKNGLIYLAAYIWLMISSIRGCMRYKYSLILAGKRMSIIPVCAFASAIVAFGVMILFTSYQIEQNFYFWVLMSIAVGLGDMANRKLSNRPIFD